MSRPSAIPEDHQGSRGAWYGQVILAVASWILLCILHWENDGLWFPQDPPRHSDQWRFPQGLPGGQVAAAVRVRPELFDPIPNHRSYQVSPGVLIPGGGNLLGLRRVAVGGQEPGPRLRLFAALLSGRMAPTVRGPGGWLSRAVLPILPGIVRYSHAILLNVPALRSSSPLSITPDAGSRAGRKSSLPGCRLCAGRPSSATRERSSSCSSRYLARLHRPLASPARPPRGHGRRGGPPGADPARCMEH